MNSEDQPGRDPQGDPADAAGRSSERLEGAEAPDDEQVEQHDRERDQRVGGRERQVLARR